MVKILIRPMNYVIEAEMGQNLHTLFRDAGILYASICGGTGECGKCRVIVDKGDYSLNGPGTVKEETYNGIFRSELACKIIVTGPLEITIPVESRVVKPKILVKFEGFIPETNSSLKIFPIRTEGIPGMAGRLSSVRLTGYKGKKPTISDDLMKSLLNNSCSFSCIVTRTPDSPEVISLMPEGVREKLFGLAIDLGTTTVAGLLVDLTTGEVCSGNSEINHQITFGEEVLTRIIHSRTVLGAGSLRDAAITSINNLIEKLIFETGITSGQILDATISGNTVMLYLFSGLDTVPLEKADTVVTRSCLVLKGQDSGLKINPGAYLYLLPVASRFIGGDAIAGILATQMHKKPETSLFIDMGTNTEIILGNEEWLASVSCASGPAFEGTGISSGMRAMRGAIDHISIGPDGKSLDYSVIGGGKPVGICGSGIIDAAVCLFNLGVIDFSGKFRPGYQKIIESNGKQEYILVSREKTLTGRDITMNENDMLYLMDSKAGIYSAISFILSKYRINNDEIKNLYLAGGFWAFTNIKSAVSFGVLPQFPAARVNIIGNSSLDGAYITLVSFTARSEASDIANRIVYHDLMLESEYIDEYLKALYIPGKPEIPGEHEIKGEDV